MNFKSFITLSEIAMDSPLGTVIPTGPAGALPTNVTGNDTPDNPAKPQVFGFDLDIPTVTKHATIQYMNDKVNPILIFLSDGTRLFLPFDAFRRIKGEPRVGKMLTVVMQRRQEDDSEVPSQVQSIHCH